MEESQAKLEHIKELNRARQARFYEKNKDKINLKRRGYEKEALAEIPIIPFTGKKIKMIDEDGNPLMDIEAINAKGNIASTTRKNYESELKRIQKFNQDRQIINTPNSHLIQVVTAMSRGNNGTALKLVNMLILVKLHFGFEIQSIYDERDRLFGEQPEHIAKFLEKKNTELPELSVLINYTRNLFDEEKFQSYIINYLLIKFGVRNKDVNCFITDDKNIVKENNSINYLYVTPKSVYFIRNDYKTVTTYGPKKNNIPDKKFFEAIKTLPNNSWLLKQDGGIIHETNLTEYVKKHTYNGLTETDYFKINIKHAMKSESTKSLLQKLSDYRGTDFNTILRYYTIGNIDSQEIEL